ncbi:MAG: MFS transporter [Verrucomicrobia bacterium]|nr:MFS transporter [Cytophagales bacterium]
MSFGFFGIQVGFALQNANMSRVFQTLGAEESKLAILWLAAPVTGLFVQPVIGYLSDRTWNVLGRRKPFFLIGAILASLALLVVPNVSALWMAAGLLWILDASINVSMEPFRALVTDMLPEEQATSGFTVQSFFIGTGSVFASSLPYLLHQFFQVRNEPVAGEIFAPNVTYAFGIGALLFMATILYTIFKTREYPPAEFAQYHGEDEKEETKKSLREIFTEIIQDFVKMPATMKQLGAVQFFTWVGLFALWIYTTSAITKHIYGTTDTKSAIYNEGADWVGVCFSVYNGVAALYAFLLPILAGKLGRKMTHALSLVVGGVGLVSIFFITDKNMLLFSMVGVGIAWASILSMPYAMLSGVLPPRKTGIYMGFFNFFIVLPQITAALILGFFVENLFHNDSIYALLVGGIFMFIAAGLTFFVQDSSDRKQPMVQ